MPSIKWFLQHPIKIVIPLLSRYGGGLSDKCYLKLMYRAQMGRRLNLKNPQSFSEKLQWLKLYDHNPEYTQMVDKYAAKKYVAGIIGEEYIIPTLGLWEKPEDIEWDKLPDKFVLKTTHDGGNHGVVICRDKESFDKEEAIRKLNHSLLAEDIYRICKEWPYKNVRKRIIAEKLLEVNTEGGLVDYKFSCFDGTATDVMVCMGRDTGNTLFYFFDREWKLLPLNIRGKNAHHNFTVPKPSCMDLMFDLAGILSKGLPYARVDFYAVNNHPYFGEITLYPSSGFDSNLLKETEKLHGSMIVLPKKNEK